MDEHAQVVGGPMDGATLPSWGPSGYHYEFGGLHYWYFRIHGKWVFWEVNSGDVPNRPFKAGDIH